MGEGGVRARHAAKAVDDECDLVEVAPAPVLARFERADDRVRGRVMVSGLAAVALSVRVERGSRGGDVRVRVRVAGDASGDSVISTQVRSS